MTLTPYFYNFHKAFSPAPIVATGAEAFAIIRVAKGHYTELTFPTDHADYTELNREYFNGTTTFNISKVVTGYFNALPITDIGEAWTDERLAIPYSVYNAIDGGTPLLFTAMNAVGQIGEELDIPAGVFATTFDRLKKYEGYELYVAVTNPSNTASIYYNADIPIQENISDKHFLFQIGDTYNTVKLQLGALYAPIVDYLGNYLVDYLGRNIVAYIGAPGTSATMPVEHPCIPSMPFYCRWINRLGGFDYWMFGNRQLISTKNSNVTTFKPYITNTETATTTDMVIGMSGATTVKVGAQGLTVNEYDTIKNIIFSPFIEYYDEKLARWVTVIPTGTIEEDTRSTRKSLELEFLLPEIQTQF